jgi:hypothetical protein
MQVDGKVGDVFYCYDGSDKGWYKVDSDHHAVPISKAEASALNTDVNDPPTLNQYWTFTKDPRSSPSSDGGVDLNHLSDWLGSHGSYMNADDLKELAENGTFKGQPVDDKVVLDTAKSLHANGDALFRKIDLGPGTGTGNGDGVIATWDIQSSITSGAVKPGGQVAGPTDIQQLSTWLAKNGNYLTKADLKELAEHGTFKGKPVTDQVVLSAAKKLHENDDYLFKGIDAVKSGYVDDIIAPWDINTPPPIPS